MTVSLFLGKEEVQMQKAQYGILRFAKYKGPEISNIEAHNERKKEKYASNPDIDNNRRNLNYHFIEPVGKYRAESNRLIEEYGCRTRKDSVRVVEVLITATPEFFKGKKKSEIRAYFQTGIYREISGFRDNPFGCGAYGRENSTYAPFLCPDNPRWEALCKRDSWK